MKKLDLLIAQSVGREASEPMTDLQVEATSSIGSVAIPDIS